MALAAFCWARTANTRLVDIRLNGDPYTYLHAAQTLRAGQGLRNYDFHDPLPQAAAGPPNAPFTTWPPLYPTLLASLGADLYAARVINAVSLWITFLLMWILYGDYGVWWGVRVASSVAYLAMLVGNGQTILSASSEAVFYPLILAFLITLPRIKERRWFLAATLLAVALPMTRYVGVAFVAVGALYVAHHGSWRRAMLYTLPAGTALGLWAARNILLTGTFTGNTLAGAYTLPSATFAILEISFKWTTSILVLSLPLALPWGTWRFLRWRISQRLSSAD